MNDKHHLSTSASAPAENLETDANFVTLIAMDGTKCSIKKECAKESELITICMTDEDDDDDNDNEVPLPKVTKEMLDIVIEFLNYHHENPMGEIEKPLKSPNMEKNVPKWYADKVNNMELETLFELINAANYLDIKFLLDLTCATVASMCKGKSPEEIRATFGIENDFTPEEEKQIREENKWAEEK